MLSYPCVCLYIMSLCRVILVWIEIWQLELYKVNAIGDADVCKFKLPIEFNRTPAGGFSPVTEPLEVGDFQNK